MGTVKNLRSVLRFGPRERDATARRLARAANVADLRAMAKKQLPGGVFDYIDGAAEDERTLAANIAAYRADGLPAARAARPLRGDHGDADPGRAGIDAAGAGADRVHEDRRPRR